ncbi:unnamed protein product [Cuscuta epithymum]|uniref:HMA domain-containing protein n=1 Tax=Cuscuta epithymum TaxID=186058 RepID=A0AAV0F271_9ASTE|nr:unnamed protein product [Cuscuta epithymum]
MNSFLLSIKFPHIDVITFIELSKGKNNDGGQGQRQGNQGEEGSNEQNPGGTIVLGVYIHCQGCADTVKGSLIGFDGVESIQVDEKNHRAIVKGKKADPIKVTERLRKKSGKHVELISPIPKPKKQENKEPKKEEKKVIEVILKIYMHCESCAKEVKQCIHKLEE